MYKKGYFFANFLNTENIRIVKLDFYRFSWKIFGVLTDMYWQQPPLAESEVLNV